MAWAYKCDSCSKTTEGFANTLVLQDNATHKLHWQIDLCNECFGKAVRMVKGEFNPTVTFEDTVPTEW